MNAEALTVKNKRNSADFGQALGVVARPFEQSSNSY
jgi:hypothetical protein